jgi:hypothetical protein
MKNTLSFLITIVAIALLSFCSTVPAIAKEIDPSKPLCDNAYDTSINGAVVSCPDNNQTKLKTTVGDVVGIALGAVGGLAVIFLIYGGLTFALSGGDPEKVKKSKSTILFSLIGLALAIAANVIVSLVMGVAGEFK